MQAAPGGAQQRLVGVEAGTVVFNHDDHAVCLGCGVHADPVGTGMAQDIGDAFLHDAQDMQRAGRLQPVQRRQFLYFPDQLDIGAFQTRLQPEAQGRQQQQ